MAMNRQTKRLMQKQGSDKPSPQQRRAQPAPVQREKTGPREYFAEVKGELRKVAWPTRKEVINSTIIVLIAVIVVTSLIFLFDLASSNFVLWLFD